MSVLLPLAGQASVDLRTGSFSESIQDFPLSRTDEFQRLYQSRSTRTGNFGFGWCTLMDNRIVKVNEKKILLETCETAKDRTDYHRASLGEWHSDATTHERILERGTLWQRISPQGQTQFYDAGSGRLIGWTGGKGEIARVIRDQEGRPTALLAFQGHRLDFATDNLGRIVRARSSTGTGLVYRYYGSDLIEVLEGGRSKWRYDYDHRHNLTQLYRSGQKLIHNFYDDRDRITGFEKGPCRDRYKYSDENRPRFSSISVGVIRECAKENPQTGWMRFHYQIKGKEKLFRGFEVSTEEGQKVFILDPVTGSLKNITPIRNGGL